MYHHALSSKLNELKSKLKNFHYSYFNAHIATQNIIKRPAAFGTLYHFPFMSKSWQYFHRLTIHQVSIKKPIYFFNQFLIFLSKILIRKWNWLHTLSNGISGFAEVKAACCGLGVLNAQVPCLPITKYCSNRNEFVFWDADHPTEAIHRVLVDNMYNSTSKYTFPMFVLKLLHV